MSDRASNSFFNRSFSTWANVLSNIGANGIVALAFLVYVPLLIQLIGVEGYGLVGIYLALQSVMTVLDMGLSVSLNRELAVRYSDRSLGAQMRDLLRTSEVFTWAIAAGIGSFSVLLAGPVASFTNPDGISYQTIFQSLLLMGAALALHFPIALYAGGLYGIQRQVQVSAAFTVFSLLKTLGSVIVLALIFKSVQAFFVWQALCAGAHAAVLAIILRRSLPRTASKAQFRFKLLAGTWKFTTGVGLVTVIATLISQVDKAVLVRVLTLENFGYYSIATVLSGNVQRLIQPVFQAYFPRLSELARGEQKEQVAGLYHQGSQTLAVLVLPVCAVLVFCSPQFLLLWQGNETTVQNTELLVSLLMAGSALNSLLYLPYALQLANGWTRLQVISQAALGVVSVPLTIVLSMQYGGAGAAAVWIAFNAAFIFISIPIMHRRLLPEEGLNWAVNDVIKPFAAAGIAAFVGSRLVSDSGSAVLFGLQLAAVYLVTLAAAIAASGEIRGWIIERIKRIGGE